MPNTLAEIIAELKTVFSTAVNLPSPQEGMVNFLTTIQGAKRSMVNQLQQPDQRISLPFIVLSLGDAMKPGDREIGLNTIGAMRFPVTVIYVSQWGGMGNNQPGVFEAAQLMKAAIDPAAVHTSFTSFYPMEEGNILSNVDAPVNNALLAQDQVQIIASAVEWVPGFYVSVS